MYKVAIYELFVVFSSKCANNGVKANNTADGKKTGKCKYALMFVIDD